MPPATPFDAARLTEFVIDAIERAGPGPSCAVMEVRWTRAAADVAAAAARRAGVVPLVPSTLAASLVAAAHRHVALFVVGRAQARRAVPLIRALARASPRAVVVFTTRSAGGRRPSRPPVNDVAGEDERLEALLRSGATEQAEAWWGAVSTTARLLGQRCRDRTLVLAVALRMRQARFEEALALAGEIGRPERRRRLAQRVRVEAARPRVSSIGVVMKHLLGAIPDLLQVIADTNESEALIGAADWARRHAGARGVAVVAAGGGHVLASGGVQPTLAERRLALESAELVVDHRGACVVASAPARVGQVLVGGIVASGPAARTETLREAVTILAIVCAPLVKAAVQSREALVRSRDRVPEIVGSSPATHALRDDIVRLAPAPFAVLIEGESGTGKELVARALHRLSPRRDRRFVPVNCAALSDELVEAELFGHSRGAFTGAVTARTGLFEDAHGGTLFLDEVAELSMRAQAKLLRVLQERELRRVGENHARAIDIRIVAATNRPLTDAVQGGGFREDLLFRLAVVRIRLMPLRRRAEDIAPLAQLHWHTTMQQLGKRAVLGADVLARMARYDWPGNVRELQNVVAGLGVAAPQRGRVSCRLLDHVLAASGGLGGRPPVSLAHARRACDRETVAAALARHAGRRSAAARELGLSRQGLGKLLRRLGLEDDPIEGVA